jgi:DNA-binding beta-propeller fold protein YncE
MAGLGFVLFSRGASTRPAAAVAAEGVQVPTYEVDASWMKPLPNNWTLGETWGVAVDSHDHVWVVHSTNHHNRAPVGQSGDTYELVAKEGKTLAPPVVEFDPQGNVVQAWGGPGSGYSWPEGGDWAEHGIWVDRNDDVWIAGNGHVVLKFTKRGKFLLQIGKLWYTGGSNDKQLLGKPTTMGTDKDTREVYVADGYYNQRVAVFDARTGAFKRQFGAYGKPIDVKYDGKDNCGDKHNVDCAVGQRNSEIAAKLDPPPDHFATVHCARVSNDGFVYVCDRSHNRVQVFKTDGTYVNEVFLDKDLDAMTQWDFKAKKAVPFTGKGRSMGSTSNATLSRDAENTYLFVGGTPGYRRLYILERKTLRLLDTLDWVTDAHELAVDSKLNIYTVGAWQREVRKSAFKGMRPLK